MNDTPTGPQIHVSRQQLDDAFGLRQICDAMWGRLDPSYRPPWRPQRRPYEPSRIVGVASHVVELTDDEAAVLADAVRCACGHLDVYGHTCGCGCTLLRPVTGYIIRTETQSRFTGTGG